MRQDKYVFSIVDFLVGVAILMILAALFVPHFVDRASTAKATESAHHAATVPPAR
jgi:Tfp pilus assembly protein FimT